MGEIVDNLSMPQPSVSKHLRVLKDVGLVGVRRDGRRMFYRTSAGAIRPLHQWTGAFERFWRHQLHSIKEGTDLDDLRENRAVWLRPGRPFVFARA